MTPREEQSEREHCVEGVFSWWVELVSRSPPHGACGRGMELWSGWHQRLSPTETIPLICTVCLERGRRNGKTNARRKKERRKNKTVIKTDSE